MKQADVYSIENYGVKQRESRTKVGMAFRDEGDAGCTIILFAYPRDHRLYFRFENKTSSENDQSQHN